MQFKKLQPQSVKGYQPPLPLLPGSLHRPFLKILHPPTLPKNQLTQAFLIDRNAIAKLSSMNIIHVKQQHNVGFFSFKFTVKYILDDVYINKIHASKCFYNKLILQGRFFPCFQFLCCIQKNPSRLISKQLGRKDISMEQVPIDSGP